MQPCGHADVDGCKQKRKKKTLTGCFERVDGRAGVWVCGRAEADNCKKKEKRKKRKEKRKTYWSGHVDVLRMGVRVLAGGHGWL